MIRTIAIVLFTFLIIQAGSRAEFSPDNGLMIAESAKAHEYDNQGYKVKVGEMAPDFKVKMTNGEELILSDLKGKVVLLNFWATWCAPCIREFQEMQPKILSVYSEDEFIFLPVDLGESEERISKKMISLEKKGIVFNSGLDVEKEIWDKYASGAIPKNIIIDRDGIVKYTATGNDGNSVEEIRQVLEKYISR